MVNVLCRWPGMAAVVAAALALASPAVALAQPRPGVRLQPGPSTPLPQGQRITAADGDTVVVEGDARVRIVRRRPAYIRILADTGQRFVVVIAEHLKAEGDTPTRSTDRTFSFHSVEGQWPLGPRWEGAAWLEERLAFEGGGMGGLLVEMPEGSIAFARRGPYSDVPANGTASVTLSFMGFGVTGGAGPIRQPFDETEAQQVANAKRNVAANSGGPGSGGIGFSFNSSSGPIGPPPMGSSTSRCAGPLRTTSHLVLPCKIHHVDAVKPPAAQSAGVSGIVILEITVAEDGTVASAKVLRSIPLLDQAALDAVRQWRYEPFVVNGRAVPRIITVTVAF